MQQGVILPGNGKEWGHEGQIWLEDLILRSNPIEIGRGNKGKRKSNRLIYRDVLSAFDIETTSFPEIKQAVMYLWQWGFRSLDTGETLVVYGRTWDEWEECARMLCDLLEPGEGLVVLDHNLSYEFQFLRDRVQFKPEDIFATEARAVVKCKVWDKLEFRCTMRHSNASLSVYLKQWHVEHQKLSGDEYDYTKVRYPWTELSREELLYGIHDVLGLIEAYQAEMQYWHDDLYTVPLTSTGYVRRICKKAWGTLNYYERMSWMPGLDVIDLLREAFRGGDTHASRYHATPEDAEGAVINYGVQSWDRSSSYPDVLINCRYPLGDWHSVKGKGDKRWVSIEELERLVKLDKAVLCRVHFKGLRIYSHDWAMPYIPKSKAIYLVGGVEDNGRILSADYLSMAITDVDWEIIKSEYVWDAVYLSDVMYCRYRYLPEVFRDVVRQFFRDKTLLKGAEPGSLEEIEYGLKKALLNALYGMAAQKAITETVLYINGEWVMEIDRDIEEEDRRRRAEGERPMTEKEKRDYRQERRAEMLEKHNKKAFLPYSIGVWCTAWARLELHRSMWAVHAQGGRTVYVDTDSNKFLGDVDLSALNEFYRARSEKNGAFADNRAGKRYYMGVYDYEYTADFATMGAKKYCYVLEGEDEIHVTIAGVNKRKGAKELAKLGGFSAFRAGTVFREAGGTQGIYNDDVYGEIEIDGHSLHIGPNVCLLQDTYTLGLSGDYARLLDSIAVRGTIDGHTLYGGE